MYVHIYILNWNVVVYALRWRARNIGKGSVLNCELWNRLFIIIFFVGLTLLKHRVLVAYSLIDGVLLFDKQTTVRDLRRTSINRPLKFLFYNFFFQTDIQLNGKSKSNDFLSCFKGNPARGKKRYWIITSCPKGKSEQRRTYIGIAQKYDSVCRPHHPCATSKSLRIKINAETKQFSKLID